MQEREDKRQRTQTGQMTPCQPHWTEMLKQTRELGLWHLVSQGGEEAARRSAAMALSGQGGAGLRPEDYDPLIGALMTAVTKAVIAGETTGCPICILAKHQSDPDRDVAAASVIENLLSAERNLAGRLKLIRFQ